jgi:hypothetical protein
LSVSTETISSTTISQDFRVGRDVRTRSRTLIVSALALLILIGFGLRATQLSAESLSEDELNKLRAVEDYRVNGLTAANGEHPFLMKALLAVSVVAAEKWNATGIVSAYPSARVPTETALRLPAALFGAFTVLLIFMLATELFGTEVGLIAAALWAFDPSAIGFNRIAKEDSFLLFFFLLGNYFWLRGQRVAESGSPRPEIYYWATAAAFGAMMASKYMPHFFAISVSYYWIFQGVKRTRWRLGKFKWLLFFAIMGAAFLVCNPTILLPGTWHEMRTFAGEKRIGHDSYEFMGRLYGNQLTLWLKGVPWYFYYLFMAIKIPLPVLIAFLVGLPLLFRKHLGEGRFFVLFWMLLWFLPFTVIGGKYTRYFTMALPVVLITAAIGVRAIVQSLGGLLTRVFNHDAAHMYTRAILCSVVIFSTVAASVQAVPNYRLYTNALGGGWEQAGNYFPHDEFYDGSVRQVVAEVVSRARQGARVASETPGLISYYAELAGRKDLVSHSLSDALEMKQFAEGDFIIVARGRRYLSNDALVSRLREVSLPVVNVSQGKVPAINLYVLDKPALAALRETLK